MHSYCELCDKRMPPGDACEWLICVSCRRGITDVTALSVYALSKGALRSWRRIQLIEMLRKRGVPTHKLEAAPLDELLSARNQDKAVSRWLADVGDAVNDGYNTGDGDYE